MTEREIFFEALEMATPEARAAYLQGACRADVTLRRKVDELLKEHFSNDSLLAEPSREGERPTINLDLPPAAAPAQMLGRYKLLEKIGEGGFGEVWMAEQREPIKRRVALKIIKLGMDSRQIVNRFAAERQALAMMDHPNIAKIFDAGTIGSDESEISNLKSQIQGGRPYFVMELVRGIKITEYCDQNQLPTHERLRLFILVCQAIQHAHQKGIIHRDIKPSNILVTLHDGVPVPKVIDFGIAKATQQELTDQTVFTQFQQFIGTPAYISPEQAEMSGLDIDTRADIYSLGVLLYELLVSQTPFDAREMMEEGLDALRQIIREREPLRPSTKLNTLAGDARATAGKRRQTDVGKLVHQLQGDLDWIVMKCLEKDRTRRYETASGLATDIQRHLSHEPVLARPPSNFYRFQKLVRRNKLGFAAAAAVALALLMGFGAVVWQWRRAESHAQSESHLHRLATEAQTAEAAQRQRAERSGAESRDRLVRLNVANGARLLEEGDYFGSLVWFAEAFDLDQGNSDKVAIHRLRIESVIRHCPRLLHCWFHSGRVNAASFSKDGRRLVTASDDQTARVWDVATGEAVTPALPHVGHVTDALFSPDGSRVLTAATDGARLWDAGSGEIRVKLDPEATISGIFSPDSSLVATRDGNATVRVWDSTTGRLVGPPLQHRRELSSMVFHPDGTRLVTACYDGAARVWNGRSGELMFTLPHNHTVRWVAISPDGKLIATANWRNTAHLWDAATGKPVVSSLPHEQWVSHVAFSPDSKSMVSSSGDGKARIWNTQNGELLRTLTHGRGLVMQSEFSPNGKWLVLRYFDGWVQAYSATEGDPIAPAIKQSWWATAVDFHPDNRRLLTAYADGTVRLWDLHPEDAVVWPWAQASVAIMGWSPERGKVVTENADGLWQVWDTKTGQSNSIAFSFTNEVMAVALSRDEQRWLSMERHFSPSTALRATVTVKTWSLKSGAMENHTEVRLSETLPAPSSLSASPDCDHLILSDRIGAEAWDLTSDRFLWRFAPENADFQSAAIFSPDGKSCALQSKRHVHILDVATGRERFSPLTNKLAVTSAAFSPDSRRLVSTCSDDSYDNGEARIWDAETGRLLLALPHIDGVECASFSPDGRMLATGGEAKVGRVFDVATGLPISPILRHEGRIFNVAFSHNGQLLATATRGSHAAVRLWDISTGEPVTPPLPLLNTVDSMFFLPGDRTLVTEVAGIFRGWNVRYGQRPSSDVAMSARLQASHQLDSTGVPSALGLTESSNFWNHLSHLYPEDFQFEEKKAMPTRQPRQLRSSVPIPPRAAMASSNLVDLTAFYGAGWSEPWANDLSLLPAGLQAFAGVTFDVRGVIQLYGDNRNLRRFPTRVEAIPIGLRCRRLRFLHAAQHQAAPDQIVGWYVIRYADGTAQEWPLVYGTNVRDWWTKSSTPSLSHAEVAWTGTTRKGEPIALYLATWENPQASLEIATVDFISARTPCAPFLIALTAE